MGTSGTNPAVARAIRLRRTAVVTPPECPSPAAIEMFVSASSPMAVPATEHDSPAVYLALMTFERRVSMAEGLIRPQHSDQWA